MKKQFKIGMIAIGDIVQKFGEPLYIYDAQCIRRQCRLLREHLPQEIDVFYSLKANPNLSIVSLIREEVRGADVSSEAELEVALRAGFIPRNIIVVAPTKDDALLGRAVAADVEAIVVETVEELEDIERIAAGLGACARVVIRINPDFHAKGAKLTMSGVASQFGLDPRELPVVMRRACDLPHVRLVGLHVYIGTRILDAGQIASNTAQILRLCLDTAERHGVSLETIDIGGGLGISYFDGEENLDLPLLGQLLGEVVAAHRTELAGVRLVLETGRFVVAESGVYATRVRAVKRSHGTTYILASGGTNHFFGATFMGGLVKRNFPVSVLTNQEAPADTPVNICGPLCSPTDLIGTKVDLPPVERGDIIGIHKVGAYGYTLSPLAFISHFSPPEVLVDKDLAILIRRRGNLDSILHPQTPCDGAPDRGAHPAAIQ